MEKKKEIQTNKIKFLLPPKPFVCMQNPVCDRRSTAVTTLEKNTVCSYYKCETSPSVVTTVDIIYQGDNIFPNINKLFHYNCDSLQTGSA